MGKFLDFYQFFSQILVKIDLIPVGRYTLVDSVRMVASENERQNKTLGNDPGRGQPIGTLLILIERVERYLSIRLVRSGRQGSQALFHLSSILTRHSLLGSGWILLMAGETVQSPI